MRKKRAKPLVIGRRTELRGGRQFKLLVLEPATRDYLLDVDGLKHFPPPKGWRSAAGIVGTIPSRERMGGLPVIGP